MINVKLSVYYYGNNKITRVTHQLKSIMFINTHWYKNKTRYSSNNVKGYVMYVGTLYTSTMQL